MESSTIAQIIRYFNITSIAISAVFACCGIIVILGRTRSNIFRRKMFLSAFCIASLLAFAVEFVFFNYKHYLKYFADGELHITEQSEQDYGILFTSDSGVTANVDVSADNGKRIVTITFTNLDRRVTSVFVDPQETSFNDNLKHYEMCIWWVDEESTRYLKKMIYKALPHENHTAIQTCGKVSKITISIRCNGSGNELNLPDIVLNRQIPIYFSGLRLLALSLLFFALILFVYKPLRVKMKYYLFEYKFNPLNKKQNFIYALSVILLILFSVFCSYTSLFAENISNTPANLQYNRYLIDAFLSGRTNLDFGHPEKLLNAERPYDYKWLINSGYALGVDWGLDISYYKGKFYSYFGPVPAVLLYLPYKLITGNYMPHHAGVSVFTAVVIIFLALLWRFLVKKYMPEARFAFYLLSFLALFFVSHISSGLRFPTVYTTVQVAGVAFTVAGTYLLLKSVDKENINYLKIFFACLCFALSVGCRPDMIFVSILVPAILWKRKSWKLAVFILIPYVMVAVPLCIYNYVRFDSIFQFGIKYNITSDNKIGLALLNPMGKIHRTLITFICYIFRPYIYSLHFPYVEFIPSRGGIVNSAFGFAWVVNNDGGLINFPILFCLIYLFKNFLAKDKPDGLRLSSIFVIIAAAIIIMISVIGMFSGRYLLDCRIFLIIPSLFCAYYWCGDRDRHGVYQIETRLKIVYVLLAVSVFVGLFIIVPMCHISGEEFNDPALYRYLESSLGFFERL